MGIVGRLDQYASMLAGEFDDYSMSENLFLYSEQFDNAVWSQDGTDGDQVTVIANSTSSPDGTLTADFFRENVTTNVEHLIKYSYTGTGTHTFSFFVKDNGAGKILVYFRTGVVGVVQNQTYFTFSTETLSNTTDASFIKYSNGWYRIKLTNSTNGWDTLAIRLCRGSDYRYNGNGVSGVYLWGAQLEVGSTATDYTPTTTTAKTRVLPSTTNTNITGLSTYFSSGFSENVGAATTLVANVFPPYDLVYDDFGGTLFGAGQGRYMRQNTDKSVIVYNEIDEVSDFYSRGVVRAGLVLDLDAGVPSSYAGIGTVWTDLSPYGNNGTLTNGPTFSSSNGGSIVFDGSDDVVNGTIDGSIFTGSFTQSAWIYKLNNTQIWQGVFTNSSPATSNTYLMTFGNGSVQAPYNSVGVNQVGVVPDGVFLDIGTHTNRWLYIVITKTGSTLNIYCYKDGSLLQTSGTITWNGGNFATTNNYQIARHWAGGAVVPLQGNVAQVSVYNRVLTSTEITQNYNALKHRFGL